MANNPFDTTRYDLGTEGTTNTSKTDVDSLFKTDYLNTASKKVCIYCGNSPMFRIIPKEDRLNTIEIEDKGYMCEYCAKKGYLNSEHYGIRPLK